MKKAIFLAFISATALAFGAGGPPDAEEQGLRQKAQKLYNDGNYKDALEIFQKLSLAETSQPATIENDMQLAVSCLQALNRDNENDAFREKFTGIHSNNWRALQAAGQSVFNS